MHGHVGNAIHLEFGQSDYNGAAQWSNLADGWRHVIEKISKHEKEPKLGG